MSSRALVLTLIASVLSGSIAFAEEGRPESGSRIVQEVVQEIGRAPGPLAAASTRMIVPSQVAALMKRIDPARSEAREGQEPTALSKSGMRKRTKVMIYLAAGVGFGATAYAIDHKVLNVTPSSLGTRKD
jgi:hypothetical protein